MPIINAVVFEAMGTKRSHPFKEKGNKYTHGQRVAALALTLRERIFPGDASRDEILTVAAWVHDIMNGIENHAEQGAARARALLSPHCSAGELDDICGIIAVPDDRRPGCDAYSDIVKLHQDADLLDHYGTFEVWSFIQYAAPHDETINDVVDWLLHKRLAEDEPYRSELNYEISGRIFDEKMDFVKRFSERFAVECAGGIWNEGQFDRREGFST